MPLMSFIGFTGSLFANQRLSQYLKHTPRVGHGQEPGQCRQVEAIMMHRDVEHDFVNISLAKKKKNELKINLIVVSTALNHIIILFSQTI